MSERTGDNDDFDCLLKDVCEGICSCKKFNDP